MNAYKNAFQAAMDNASNGSPGALGRALNNVNETYPITAEMREAIAQEAADNHADPLRGLEEQLSCLQFKPNAPWGLAIYRTAYDDPAAWDQMLELIQDSIESVSHEPINQHLHPRHAYKIFDDSTQFEKATISHLRNSFSNWVMNEYMTNCRDNMRPSAEEFKAYTSGRKCGYAGGARYNFFIVVDDICLESISQDCGAVIKLVQGAGPDEFEPSLSTIEIEEMGGPLQDDSLWEGGLTENEFENVGWMYYDPVEYVILQDRLAMASNWEDEYLRPPLLRDQDGFEDAPGSWRRDLELT